MATKKRNPAAEKTQRGSDNRSNTAPIITQASKLAELGIGIIPIPYREKGPRLKGWTQAGTTDPKAIRRIFESGPSNYGLLMGDGYIAIDVDGEAGLNAIAERGLDLPDTRTHITPGGGLHFIYTVAPDFKCKNTVKLMPDVDIRYAGAQIVGPGSVHPNGGVYEVEDDRAPVPLPDEWLAVLAQPTVKERVAAKTQRITTRGKVAVGARNSTLASELGKLHSKGVSGAELEEHARRINAGFETPLPADEVSRTAASIDSYPVPANVAAMLNDERPRVLLSSDNRLTSDVAAELGPHLSDDLYNHGGEVVCVERGRVRVITPQEFCTLVERYVVCCKWRKGSDVLIQVGVTMSVEESRKLLASRQLRSQLRTLKRVATCPLPVMRADGTIELLEAGYDEATGTLTVPDGEYRSDMTLEEAVAFFTDLFSEFEFVGSRDKAVAIAAIVSLYAQQLMEPTALRPTFIYTKNAEGAGATICASLAIVTALGYVPTGTAPTENEEMRKMLTTTVREGRTVAFLDNVKTTIGCAALEAFVTSPTWSDRLLGVNESGEYENNVTVLATGNGATCTPDMRRRSLVVELLMTAERAEDKVFKRELTINTIKSLRADIAAASWALVRHWDEAGRPVPGRSHSAFPEWARVIGGIVEAAGFGCALETPGSENARVDEDGEAMKALAEVMAERMKERKVSGFSTKEMYNLCQVAEVFPHLVGSTVAGMPDRSKTTILGLIFSKYNGRIVGDFRFSYAGQFRARRYTVEAVAGDFCKPTYPANLSGRMNKNTTRDPARGQKGLQRMKVCKPPSKTPPMAKRQKFAEPTKRQRSTTRKEAA